MSFSVGIVGLPNTGKSTLFKALTKKPVEIAAYPFTTISPNVGVVGVPDLRLKKIAEIIKPEKVTPASVEFIDIAGLVQGAYKGAGLGNQFLAKIRECDAILEVVRAFEATEIEHIEKTIDPQRDIEIIKTELIMKDLETVEKALPKIEKEAKSEKSEVLKKIELLKKIKLQLSQFKPISELNLTKEEISLIKEFQFLSAKPIIYVYNIGRGQILEKIKSLPKGVILDLKLEQELSELSERETRELNLKSNLDQLILASYNVLDLITFYTICGQKETRAWAIKRGTLAPQAGGCVHSDFEEKFIRAQVIPWQKLIEAGSWSEAQKLGWIKTVGKDYVMQDGDVIEFKI